MYIKGAYNFAGGNATISFNATFIFIYISQNNFPCLFNSSCSSHVIHTYWLVGIVDRWGQVPGSLQNSLLILIYTYFFSDLNWNKSDKMFHKRFVSSTSIELHIWCRMRYSVLRIGVIVRILVLSTCLLHLCHWKGTYSYSRCCASAEC